MVNAASNPPWLHIVGIGEDGMDGLTPATRAVVEAAWSVVLVDGERANEEDALLRLIASLLGVNDRDSALARQKAAALILYC